MPLAEEVELHVLLLLLDGSSGRRGRGIAAAAGGGRRGSRRELGRVGKELLQLLDLRERVVDLCAERREVLQTLETMCGSDASVGIPISREIAAMFFTPSMNFPTTMSSVMSSTFASKMEPLS